MPWTPGGKLQGLIVTFALGSLPYLIRDKATSVQSMSPDACRSCCAWFSSVPGSVQSVPRFHHLMAHCGPFKAPIASTLMTFYRLIGRAASYIVSCIWKPHGPPWAALLVKYRQ